MNEFLRGARDIGGVLRTRSLDTELATIKRGVAPRTEERFRRLRIALALGAMGTPAVVAGALILGIVHTSAPFGHSTGPVALAPPGGSTVTAPAPAPAPGSTDSSAPPPGRSSRPGSGDTTTPLPIDAVPSGPPSPAPSTPPPGDIATPGRFTLTPVPPPAHTVYISANDSSPGGASGPAYKVQVGWNISVTLSASGPPKAWDKPSASSASVVTRISVSQNAANGSATAVFHVFARGQTTLSATEYCGLVQCPSAGSHWTLTVTAS